ncbi:MAG: hypothetical protein GQ534_06430, partial [Candidatus Delongbacteria bacterium]|nr:hypothetical protein [Candidatus Delongbacteria bacterium]
MKNLALISIIVIFQSFIFAAADIEVSVSSLNETLYTGETSIQQFDITNVGTDTLFYTIEQFEGPVKASVKLEDIERIKYPKGSRTRPKGEPVLKDMDRGDEFSYTWIDSDELGGPIYNWVDIQSIGTEVITNGDYTHTDDPDPEYLYDEAYKTIVLPFEFPFYDQVLDSISISSNGQLFTGDWYEENYNYQIFPDPLEVNNVIAPFWCDLDASFSGQILHYYDESNNSFIVQYENIPEYNYPDTTYTFQVILYESGKIKYQYADIEDDLEYYVTGIENSNGTIGTLIADSTPYLKNGMAIELIPWVSLNNYSGELTAGMSKTIDVKFDAEILREETYLNNILITSNDLENSEIMIPVDLTVTSPDIEVSVESLVETLNSGEFSIQQFNITNSSGGILAYSINHHEEPVKASIKLSETERIKYPKGSKERPKGEPVLKDMGGGDEFSYTWVDSDELGGPIYNWVDIQSIGTEVITNGDYTHTDDLDPEYLYDEAYKTIALPFEFPFYGQFLNSISISSNGQLFTGDWYDENYNYQIFP